MNEWKHLQFHNNWAFSIYLLISVFLSFPSIQYAQETQHEKILRGLAVGIALTMFNRLEESDALVKSLSTDKDPVLRRSGMYTIAMAYCGTGNNQAIRKLLHVAVSISLNLNIERLQDCLNILNPISHSISCSQFLKASWQMILVTRLLKRFYILFTLNTYLPFYFIFFLFFSSDAFASPVAFSFPHRRNKKKKVSDVNDDVRRAAVTGIGFLLFRWVQKLFLSFGSHPQTVPFPLDDDFFTSSYRESFLSFSLRFRVTWQSSRRERRSERSLED